MKIFNLPEAQKDLLEKDSGKFWFSFISFNSRISELKNQDKDIFKTKTDFENYDRFIPAMTKQEQYEERERMV